MSTTIAAFAYLYTGSVMSSGFNLLNFLPWYLSSSDFQSEFCPSDFFKGISGGGGGGGSFSRLNQALTFGV